jgi:cytochrome P450
MALPDESRSPSPSPPPPDAAKPIRFNPFSPEFRNDPYPQYHLLRAREPIHRTMGMWVLTRYEDIRAVLIDRRFSSSQIPELVKMQGQRLGQEGFGAIEQLGRKSIVFTDRPEHTRLRHLVNKAFNSAVVEARRPHITATAERLVDELVDKGHLEFIADFADPLPLHVMSDMMALPQEARPVVRDWTHRIRFFLEPSLMSRNDFEQAHSVLLEYMAFFRELVRERRERPGDDLISSLLAARAGEDRLSEDEVIFTCIMTFVAGHETTKALLGNGMLALLRHPEQLHLLLQRPELIGSTVEEMLRYDSPLQMTKRKATEDLEIGGRAIRQGEQLLLCLGAANRDPERFQEPDRFDITRSDNAHIAFGFGMHSCLGGLLANVEAQLALGVLLRRLRDLRLGDEQLEWSQSSFIVRGLKRLPITFRS